MEISDNHPDFKLFLKPSEVLATRDLHPTQRQLTGMEKFPHPLERKGTLCLPQLPFSWPLQSAKCATPVLLCFKSLLTMGDEMNSNQ